MSAETVILPFSPVVSPAPPQLKPTKPLLNRRRRSQSSSTPASASASSISLPRPETRHVTFRLPNDENVLQANGQQEASDLQVRPRAPPPPPPSRPSAPTPPTATAPACRAAKFCLKNGLVEPTRFQRPPCASTENGQGRLLPAGQVAADIPKGDPRGSFLRRHRYELSHRFRLDSKIGQPSCFDPRSSPVLGKRLKTLPRGAQWLLSHTYKLDLQAEHDKSEQPQQPAFMKYQLARPGLKLGLVESLDLLGQPRFLGPSTLPPLPKMSRPNPKYADKPFAVTGIHGIQQLRTAAVVAPPPPSSVESVSIPQNRSLRIVVPAEEVSIGPPLADPPTTLGSSDHHSSESTAQLSELESSVLSPTLSLSLSLSSPTSFLHQQARWLEE